MSWFSNLFKSSVTRESANPAGTSSYSRMQVSTEAAIWTARSPERSWAQVAPTGSMLPVLDSNSILLREKVTGLDLRPGDIASYDDLKGGTICHRVREVNNRGAVLFTGDNNRNTSPDGWIASDRIRFRIAGILYTKPS